MAEWIGIGRRARRCYGFDEVALAPGPGLVILMRWIPLSVSGI